VSKEEIGFLPGDIKEKLDPWLAPIYGNFNLLLVKHLVQELFDSDVVEIVPVSFMRGRTFPKAAIIVDECQNLEDDQTLMILQRIGRGSKMMFCGDAAQTDLKRKSRSGLGYLASLADKIKGLGIVELLSNHRHPILDEIIPMYESKNK
jgi:phosphate starvation-inducible PhoH-like protein